MRRSRLLVVLLSALALLSIGAGVASASDGGPPQAPRAPQIGWVSPIAWGSGPEQATVLGSYRCWGDSTTMHLWVSLKQGGANPTAEGSSTTVDAWYDTNISQDVAVTCNGRWQVTAVDLGRHPVANRPGDTETTPPTRQLGYLHGGRAWLQFCLVPPGAETDPSLLASENRWVHVVGTGRH